MDFRIALAAFIVPFSLCGMQPDTKNLSLFTASSFSHISQKTSTLPPDLPPTKGDYQELYLLNLMRPSFFCDDLRKVAKCHDVDRRIGEIKKNSALLNVLSTSVETGHSRILQAMLQKKCSKEIENGRLVFYVAGEKLQKKFVQKIIATAYQREKPSIIGLLRRHGFSTTETIQYLNNKTLSAYAAKKRADCNKLDSLDMFYEGNDKKWNYSIQFFAKKWEAIESMLRSTQEGLHLSFIESCKQGDADLAYYFLELGVGVNREVSGSEASLFSVLQATGIKPLDRLSVVRLLCENDVEFMLDKGLMLSSLLAVQSYRKSSLGKALQQFFAHEIKKKSAAVLIEKQQIITSCVLSKQATSKVVSKTISLPEMHDVDISPLLHQALKEKDLKQFLYLVILGVPLTKDAITETVFVFKSIYNNFEEKICRILHSLQQSKLYKDRRKTIFLVAELLQRLEASQRSRVDQESMASSSSVQVKKAGYGNLFNKFRTKKPKNVSEIMKNTGMVPSLNFSKLPQFSDAPTGKKHSKKLSRFSSGALTERVVAGMRRFSYKILKKPNDSLNIPRRPQASSSKIKVAPLECNEEKGCLGMLINDPHGKNPKRIPVIINYPTPAIMKKVNLKKHPSDSILLKPRKSIEIERREFDFKSIKDQWTQRERKSTENKGLKNKVNNTKHKRRPAMLKVPKIKKGSGSSLESANSIGSLQSRPLRKFRSRPSMEETRRSMDFTMKRMNSSQELSSSFSSIGSVNRSSNPSSVSSLESADLSTS